MLLDEIEELTSTINQAHDNMEQIYAIYLHQFPTEAMRIDKLNAEYSDLLSMIQHSAPRHDVTDDFGETTGGGLVPMEAFNASAYFRDLREEQKREAEWQAQVDAKVSELDAEVKAKQVKNEQMSLRYLFRKLNQLCHPDKTRHLDYKVTKRLRDCFDEAHKVYVARDYTRLQLLYVRVMFLRGEQHKLDDGIVSQLKARHDELLAEMQVLAQHHLFLTLHNHIQKRYTEAQQHFRRFLIEYMERIMDKIDDTQKQLAA